MLGLVVVFFIGLYLIISLLVIFFSARTARKHGRRGWVWGLVAAFVMYNLVFWDWIPTVAMHKYYCATEAGFWVYKTPEEWAKENPGVLATLKPWPRSKIYGVNNHRFELNGGTVRQYNDRFGYWSKRSENLGGLMVGRIETGIIDVKSHELLVRYIDFLSGPRGAGEMWKSWLKRGNCGPKPERPSIRQMAVQLNMGNL
jgi:hypothetical protein